MQLADQGLLLLRQEHERPGGTEQRLAGIVGDLGHLLDAGQVAGHQAEGLVVAVLPLAQQRDGLVAASQAGQVEAAQAP